MIDLSIETKLRVRHEISTHKTSIQKAVSKQWIITSISRLGKFVRRDFLYSLNALTGSFELCRIKK